MAGIGTASVHRVRTRTQDIGADNIRDAGKLLRRTTAAPTANVTAGSVLTGIGAAGGQRTEDKPAPQIGGNTFIFQKPVETPYRHAQAIREVMEEMLYGT